MSPTSPTGRTSVLDRPRTARRRLGIGALALVFAAPLLVAAPAEADAYPTWDEVESARGSESAKDKQIDSLTGIIGDLQRSTTRAQAAAEKAGQEYADARDALDLVTGTREKLVARQRAAQKKADDLGRAVGQIAATLARPGSGSTTVQILSSGDDATDVLQGLGLASKLGERVDDSLDEARAATNSARSLADQAKVVTDERARLATASQAALERAATASAAAAAAQQEQEQNLGVLNAQLATLRDDRLSIEDGYQQGVAARAAEAARVAARAAAAERARKAAEAAAAAAAVRPPAGGSTGGSTGGGGSPAPGAGSSWVRPITAYSFYQAYGYRIHPIYHDLRLHTGADFSASCGTPIYATHSGTVTYAGPSGGYGNMIIVSHGGGITSAYAHLYPSGIYVRAGQTVSAGQNIAGVGSSGDSTGCHLHFEIRRGGVATDPMAYLASH